MTTAVASSTTTNSTSAPRVTFGSLVRTEWIALSSLRGTLTALLIGTALVVLPAAAFALVYGLDFASATGAERTEMMSWIPGAGAIATNGVMFSVVVATIVGSSLFAKEHTTGSLRTQLSASPRRIPMFAAKAIVVTISTYVAALVAFAISFAATAAIYAIFEMPMALDDVVLDAVLPVAGAALFTASVALFALGIAGILRSDTWTITLALAFLFVIPTLLMTLPWEWAPEVADTLLGTTGHTLAVPQAEIGGDFLRDLALTVGWAAAAFFGGAAIMNRRDA